MPPEPMRRRSSNRLASVSPGAIMVWRCSHPLHQRTPIVAHRRQKSLGAQRPWCAWISDSRASRGLAFPNRTRALRGKRERVTPEPHDAGSALGDRIGELLDQHAAELIGSIEAQLE